MPVSVRLEGVEAVLAQLRAIGQAVPEDAARGLLIVGNRIAARVRELCPVDTGALKRSLGAWREGKGAESFVVVGVRPDSETAALDRRGRLKYREPGLYAPFLEFGTARARAQPFLRPAVDAEAQAAPQVVAEVVDAGMARVAGK
jgi:HK97 gp10 family phage protein